MGFTRKLAFAERVNSIAVATDVVYSDWVRLRYEAPDLAIQEHWMVEKPLSRSLQPEEVAAAILFLASDDASYMTGIFMAVNGGQGAADNDEETRDI
jgi:meso-butanediol dehydrogenase/(S,S)-butanediol dehydrogenase/diacetyl reductase